ncbi:MAG: outer membrane protein assembly factor BamA [Maricaulaceae bacterium]
MTRLVVSVAMVMMFGAGLAASQTPPPPAPETSPEPASPAAIAPPVIRAVTVEGSQRLERGTVLSYLLVGPGEVADPQRIDLSLKTLFDTGLFADVAIELRGDTLVIRVIENPVINQIIFEGVRAVDEDTIREEIEVQPRAIYTRARVQADVQRIIEVYRRSGRYAVNVSPQVRQLEQNRVDLIFEISEGARTGMRKINFIGNENYSDGKLRSQIATTESRLRNFLSSNSNFDPDRLEFDREQLRIFYRDEGFADFQVTSAVAELTPDQKDWYLTFTISEGEKFQFGDVDVDTELDAINPDFLLNVIPIKEGQQFKGSLIEDTVDRLTFFAGTAGYAFADILPRLRRNREENTVDVLFEINEGPRVYVDRIDIVGNVETLDRVIRRDLQFVEGDAFNQVLLDRSRQRLRGLGFFEDVTIENTPASLPDRTNVEISVSEQPTGELSFGAGFSSIDAFLLDLSITQSNLRGRGQFLRARVAASARTQQIDLRFTEPRFLDRNLAAAWELFRVASDFFAETGFENTSMGASFRLGFPLSPRGQLALRWTIRQDALDVAPGLPINPITASQVGDFLSSIIGFTYRYDRRNDPILPTRGFDFSISQNLAGFGGNVAFTQTELRWGWYYGIWQGWIFRTLGDAGYIRSLGDDSVRVNDRFFRGGQTFRGFNVAGIGPRVPLGASSAGQALGGNAFAIVSAELEFPIPLPEEYGIRTALFIEAGSLGILDDEDTSFIDPTFGTEIFIDDSLSLRASAGLSVFWNSPFGPVRFDISQILAQEEFDVLETFRFSTATRF